MPFVYRKKILARALLLATAFASLCLAILPAHSQTIEQRQTALRGIRRDRPRRETISRADWRQIAEDYKVLQLSAYKLKDALKIQEDVDYRLVKSSAGEIKKRAHRLRTYLLLPDVKTDKRKTEPKVPATSAELVSAIDELTKHISDFVTNPIFESLRVLDVQQSEKANRDLIEITRLSNSIKLGAELLKSRN